MNPTPMPPPGRRRLASLLLLSLATGLTSCLPSTPPAPKPTENAGTGDPQAPGYRPPPQASTEILEVPATGINLGWGWNSVSSEPVANVCVEFAEASEPAQARQMTMREISDNYDLMQSMGMSAEASVKTIGVEVDGKAKFAKDMHVSRFASNFVMNATVENGVRYAAPTPGGPQSGSTPEAVSSVPKGEIRLTPEALRLAQKSDPGEFIHRCGHGFVSAVYSGAKLTAVITVDTSSREEKQKVSAELSGSGWGARVKSAMEAESKKTAANQSMSVSVFQVGGRGDSIPVTTGDVLTKLETLSAIAFDAPKDFHMAVAPYESLANWPAKTMEVDANEYDQMANLWGAYNALYDDLQQVLDAPMQFLGAKTNPVSGCTELVPLVTTQTKTYSVASSIKLEPPFFGISSIPTTVEKTSTAVTTDHDQMDQLQKLQDEVQDTLRRLRSFAQNCSANDRGCEFPESAFRSPYAYRVQMPLEAGPSEEPVSPEDILQIQVAAPAKQRCTQDVDDTGCLSNAQIDSWRDKLGMQLATYATMDERNAVVERLASMQLAGAPASCDASRHREGPAFSVEPDYPALWFHPVIANCVKDPAASREACMLRPKG